MSLISHGGLGTDRHTYENCMHTYVHKHSHKLNLYSTGSVFSAVPLHLLP